MKITSYFPTKQSQVKCFAVTRWGSTNTVTAQDDLLKKGRKAGEGLLRAVTWTLLSSGWIGTYTEPVC